MTRPTAAIFALLALAAADAPPMTDADRIQGTWKPLAAELGGQPLPPDEVRGTLTIRKDTFRVEGGAGPIAGTITLDPSRRPRACDLVVEQGPDRGKILRGIYQVDGDVLRLCVGRAGRPEDFACKAPASEYTVLRRARAFQE